MKKWPLSRWALVGVVGAVVLVIAGSTTSHGQQRVQTTQLTVKKPVVADPLADWEKHYAAAIDVAREIADSGSPENGERLENDLKGLDAALREYVRVSERLRHKDRALSDTMEFLALQNNIQMQSRQYQTISNALTASHEAESNTVKNMK